MSKIQDRASFDLIRYANCWEDADLLIKTFSEMESPKCVSISSAGDNSLSLLTLDPEVVVAFDLSKVQLASLELRIVAFENLEYEETLYFLGLSDNNYGKWNRKDIFNRLKSQLNSDARSFWSKHEHIIATGVIHSGKFEKYLKVFGQKILPFIHSENIRHQLCDNKSLSERNDFYNQKWDNLRWRAIFKLFFSKKVMGRLGRDPEFFKYVETSIGSSILARTKHALTEIDTHTNPYLNYIIFGDFNGVYPHCFRKENYEKIKSNLSAIELYNGSTTELFKEYDIKFNAFNFSDIFEYMDENLFKIISSEIIENSENDSLIAYWNMMVPRNIYDIFPENVDYLEDKSKKLLKEDNAFFYQDFIINRVKL